MESVGGSMAQQENNRLGTPVNFNAGTTTGSLSPSVLYLGVHY